MNLFQLDVHQICFHFSREFGLCCAVGMSLMMFIALVDYERQHLRERERVRERESLLPK